MSNPFKKAGSFLLDHSRGMLICSLVLFACSIGTAALINHNATSGGFVSQDDSGTVLTPIGMTLEGNGNGGNWNVDYSDLPDRSGTGSGSYNPYNTTSGNSSDDDDSSDVDSSDNQGTGESNSSSSSTSSNPDNSSVNDSSDTTTNSNVDTDEPKDPDSDVTEDPADGGDPVPPTEGESTNSANTQE